jgi:hypothetical protein
MIKEFSIRVRQAEPHDAISLARLHLICSEAQPGGFMHHLGRGFFVKYYQTILALRKTVVLCADAGQDGVVGFVSATLDSKGQLEAIRKARFRLFMASIPALIRRPGLIRPLYIRLRSLWAEALGEGFIVGSGARICYWGWRPGYPSKGRSIFLLKELLHLMQNQGVSRLQLEVDRPNRKVEVVHRILGARIVKEFITKDGRQRIIMEHCLQRLDEKSILNRHHRTGRILFG